MASKKPPVIGHRFCEHCEFYYRAYRAAIALHEAGKCKEPVHV